MPPAFQPNLPLACSAQQTINSGCNSESYSNSLPSRWKQYALLAGFGIIAFGLAAIVGYVDDFPPAPEVHDEFGILLSAETYANGRLTNPSHPMARFFDTIYVIQEPTYIGKYPPLQAIMLALGKLLTGEFIVGAWISCGIMAIAVLWMFQTLLPTRWAIFGATIAVLQIGIFSYWTHSYWGSTMAVAAGALVLGATVRARQRPRRVDGFTLGIGLILLANSRPYDGLALSIAPILYLLWTAWSQTGEARRLLLFRVFVPCALILAFGFSWMGYNNHQVTGNPFRMAYQEHSNQYMTAPAFLWQRLGNKKSYSHEALRVHHEEWEVRFYQSQRSLKSFMRMRLRYLTHIWSFYINWVLTIPLLIGLYIAIRRDYLLPLISMMMVFGAVMVTTWGADRFVSPAASVIFLVITLGVRQLCALCNRPLLGYAIAGIFPILILIMTIGFNKQVITTSVASVHPMKTQRSLLLKHLLDDPGDDLVIVRSAPSPESYFEWVYNGATIDQQPVIFARFRDLEDNQQLIAYYPRRHVWLLDVGANDQPVRLRAYGNETVKN